LGFKVQDLGFRRENEPIVIVQHYHHRIQRRCVGGLRKERAGGRPGGRKEGSEGEKESARAREREWEGGRGETEGCHQRDLDEKHSMLL
jgi:hypothetical protein